MLYVLNMFASFVKDLNQLLPAEPKRRPRSRDRNPGQRQRRRTLLVAPLSTANIFNIQSKEQELAPKRQELNTKLHTTVKKFESFAKLGYCAMAERLLLQATSNTYWNKWEELPMGGNSYMFKDNILYVFTDVAYNDVTTNLLSLGNKKAMWLKIRNRSKPDFIWCCPDTGAPDIPVSIEEKSYLVVIIRRGINVDEKAGVTMKRVRHRIAGMYLKTNEWSDGYEVQEYTIPSGINKGVKMYNQRVFSGKRVLYMEPLYTRGSKTLRQRHTDIYRDCLAHKDQLLALSTEILNIETELRSNRDSINDNLESRILDICLKLAKANGNPKRLAECQYLLNKLDEDTSGLYWNNAVTTPLKGRSNQIISQGRSTFSYVLARQKSVKHKCTWLDNKNILFWYLPADEALGILIGSVVGVIQKQDTTPVTHVFRGLYMAMFTSRDDDDKLMLVLRRLNPDGIGFDSDLATLCTEEEQTKRERKERIKQIKRRYKEIEEIRLKYAEYAELKEKEEVDNFFDETFGSDDEGGESKN